jgi:hypothetical protein
VHAKKAHLDITVNGILDAPTMRALVETAPEPGKKAWDIGHPTRAPIACWEASKRLRIVVVKDEHLTFLFDDGRRCVGIFPNGLQTARHRVFITNDVGAARRRPGATATSRSATNSPARNRHSAPID